MQLGFVTAILPEQNLESIGDIAANIGYECIEVMCWPKGKAERRYAGISHIDINGLTQSRADEIVGDLKNKGITISGLGYYPNLLSKDIGHARPAMAHLKKLIKSAPKLGVDIVNTFIGAEPSLNDETNFKRFRKFWPSIIKLAEDHDVQIGIENCPMYFTQDEWPSGKNLAHSPAMWRRMFDVIPSKNFGLNYDPSHMVWQHMDYLKPIREFAVRFVHVHAKDVRLDQDRLNDVGIMATPLSYHSPKLPGLGEVDWGKFLSVLSDAGYQGAVCVEVEDRAYEGNLISRKAALSQSYRYLKNFMP
ncbi:sugar phosphate isomerase/epimerase [bacterium]|nr:sugar phosphate isomerase/epimerase [bacterium]